MTAAAELVTGLLRISILLTVLGLGLRASFSDATSLFRHPGKLIRSLLAMNIVMPAFTVLLATTFELAFLLKVALVVLAVSPVPPFLPVAQFKLGGASSYVYGLLITASLFSIVFIPLSMLVLDYLFGLHLAMSPTTVARIVFFSILVPLLVGMLIRHWAPLFAEQAATWVLGVGNVCLLIGSVCLIVAAWRPIISLIGNGTLLIITVFVVAGLITGYFLGGHDPGERTSLALATASRHPAVALAIAKANFPSEKLVFAAVLLYLIINTVASIPFKIWSRKHGPLDTSTPAHPAHHRI